MSRFTDLDKQMNEKFENSYKGEVDIAKILDLSRFKDNVDGLIEEMLKQPSIYAYWANLRRLADEKYNAMLEKFEIIKSRKRITATQLLETEGHKKPSIKLVETKLAQMASEDDTLKKYSAVIKLWKRRKEQLFIVERAIASRESSFKSLSYLLSNMMRTNLIPQKSTKNHLSVEG